MKTKRRTGNVDKNVYNKKIITRNMKSKIIEDKSPLISASCNNLTTNKTSSKTRAKTISTGKLDSDPYSLSKMDEECKIPIKKLKMTEKVGKDVSANTSCVSTMTEPELLGSCEPGTTIALQGIVWLETETGLLVINVTWKGRTYVGTLLDSSRYQSSSIFNSQDCPLTFENPQSNRPNRTTKRYIPPSGNCHNSCLRSHSIRHSCRLSNSFCSQDNRTKSSTRLVRNINSRYVDSLSLSADASLSGESDTEMASCKKFSLHNKNRSVTRSLAKQKKVLDSLDTDSNPINSDRLLKCTQTNCFKKFTDYTALRYHLQRCHNHFEEIVKAEKSDNDGSTKKDHSESDHEKIATDTERKSQRKRINGTIKTEDDKYEFYSDSELKNHENGFEDIKPTSNETDTMASKNSFHGTQMVTLEPRIDLPRIPEISPLSNEGMESYKEENPLNIYKDDGLKKQNEIAMVELITSIQNQIPHSSGTLRTVTAPTVSIPVESSQSIMSSNTLSNTSVCPSIIRPKQNPHPQSLVNNPQSSKVKPSKITTSLHVHSNFQIPSSNVLSKKRPLIPLKVAVSQNSTASHNRIISSTNSLNVSSQNNFSRNLRTTSFSNVTPILPATSIINNLTQTLSNSTITTVSVSGIGNNSSINSNNVTNGKRPITTSTSTSPNGVSSLLNLKPIQPKPKVSSSIITTTPSIIVSSASTATVSGIPLNHTSYQRQILPNPVSKVDNFNYTDERFIHKIEKSTSIKKKRRKPDIKLRVNLSKCNVNKTSQLNPIQPRQNCNYQEFIADHSYLSASLENYKMDEENSHSPTYSDHSETNDTPAPILEKEVELKSGESDKLVICTDFEVEQSSPNRISACCLENDGENKDCLLYNKPPALMPAVLSTDLLNGATNEIDNSDIMVKTARKKLSTNKKSTNSYDPNIKVTNFPATMRHNINNNNNNSNINTSTCKSFQSFSPKEEATSASICSSSNISLYNSSSNDSKIIDQNSKTKITNKYSNLSAINDYVWMIKNNQDPKSKSAINSIDELYSVKSTVNDKSGKIKIIPTQSNGKFSVKALTSQQDIASRTFTSSTTAISVNPNTKLANSLSKD